MIALKFFYILFAVFVTFPARGQAVRAGTIDVYGNRSISTDTILKRAGISKGDTIGQRQLADRVIERRLEEIEGVKVAQTAMICCDNQKQYVLFLGISENDSAELPYRESPKLKIMLPDSYRRAYTAFKRRQKQAVLVGQAGDDWSNGHPMIKYPPARRIQERYLRWANSEFIYLQKILRSSVYDQQRATAVQIIAYNDDTRNVIPELLYAMRDENNEVRSNAIEALAAISYYMTLHPGEGELSFEPFIRMINSVVWADRIKGLSVLMQLSESRNRELFSLLRETSMPALKEMAQWKSEAHAKPAYVILARMAGQSDEKIFKATSDGNFADNAAIIVRSLE